MPRVNRVELLGRLQAVSPGLSQKEVTEQSNAFVFKGGFLYTFNDEVSCRIPSGLGDDPEGVDLEGAVRAKPVLELLEKLTEDEVDLEVGDGELLVKGKGRAAGITMEREVLLAVASVEDPIEWRDLPEGFAEAVQMVSSCAGTDDTRFYLTCVHIGSEHVEACDNFQLNRYILETGVEKDFLVRRSAVRNVTTLGMTEISETPAWVHFRNPSGLVLSCRRYLEDYPNLTSVLEVDGEPLTLPGGLAEAVEKAMIFSRESPDDDKVLVELKQGRLKVKGQGVNGWFRETKALAYQGPPVAFLVSPLMLMEISKKHKDVFITSDRLKVEGGSWKYVACLVKADTKKESGGRVETDGEGAIKPKVKKKAVAEEAAGEVPRGRVVRNEDGGAGKKGVAKAKKKITRVED